VLVGALVPSPVVLVGGIAFLATLGNPSNSDLLWHLSLGRLIVLGRALPNINSLYYSTSSGPGLDYSWLSQVVLYEGYRLAGPAGLALITALCAGITFGVLYKMLERSGQNLLVNVIALTTVFLASCMHFSGRPAGVTVLFFAIIVYTLDRYVRSEPTRLWLVPLIMPLWVNLHPGFVIGIAAIAIALALAPSQRRRALLVCLLASLAALILNPFAARVYLMPFDIARSLSMLSRLTEWSGASGWCVLVWGVLFGAGVAGMSLRRPPPTIAVLFGALAVAAALAVRFLPLFAVCVLPTAVPAVAVVHRRLEQLSLARRFSRGPHGAHGWLWVGVLPAAVLFLSTLSWSPVVFRLDLTDYPVRAVQYLKSETVSGNLFVPEPWSGFVLWEMPGRRLFFDAKGGFSPQAMADHRELMRPSPNWRSVAAKYDVGAFLLESGSPTAVMLKEARGWSLAWTDSVASLFIRRPPE
jgi:hypothetical protein